MRAENTLSSTRPVTEITTLVLPVVCDRVLEALHVEAPEIGKERAPKAVALLLAGYPQAALRTRDAGQDFDFKAYCRVISKVVAKFPEYAVLGMIERKPWDHPHLPSEPEIKGALQDEVTRRAVIINNAKAHKREAHRRQQEADEESRLAADRARLTPEERKARADALVARMKAAAVDPVPPRPVQAKPKFDMAADLASIRERATPERLQEIESEIGGGAQ